MGQQGSISIPMSGGLNLVDPYATLQQSPGQCSEMINFVQDLYAGYKKVNGYAKFGDTQVTGSADKILGVLPYADGVLAVAGTGVYYSEDGSTWLQLNRDTWTQLTGTVEVVNSTGASGAFINVVGSGTSFLTDFQVDDYIRIDGEVRKVVGITDDTTLTVGTAFTEAKAALTLAYKEGTTSLTGTILPRTDQERVDMDWYPDDGDYGSVVITDTSLNIPPTYIRINGSGVSRTYEYTVLDEDGTGAPQKAKYCCIFKDRMVVANNGDKQGYFAWSDADNIKDFFNGNDQYIDGRITGVKPLKDILIIFTETSIYQLQNIDDINSYVVAPVTNKLGCLSGFSVQEVAGDLIFLSGNAFRTLSASDKYGDVQMVSASRKIDPLVQRVLATLGSSDISSVYINEKGQYRLFYATENVDDSTQNGLCAVFQPGATGELEWSWSQLLGIPPSCMGNLTFADGTEKTYHGGYDGYVYTHDTGNSFDGREISALVELHPLDFGNQGQRKTLHYGIMRGRTEGSTNDIIFETIFDNNQATTMQPPALNFTLDGAGASYGNAVYGTNTYSSGREVYWERFLLQGSGYDIGFRISTVGTDDPFLIDTLYIDFRMGGLW